MPFKTSQFTDAKASPQLSAKAHHHDDESHDHAPGQSKEPACFTFLASTPRGGLLGNELKLPYAPTRRPLLPTVGAGGDATMQDATVVAGGDTVMQEAPPFNYLTLPSAPCMKLSKRVVRRQTCRPL